MMAQRRCVQSGMLVTVSSYCREAVLPSSKTRMLLISSVPLFIYLFIYLNIKAENKIEIMENPVVRQPMMRPCRLIN
jgi:hypothetical protein